MRGFIASLGIGHISPMRSGGKILRQHAMHQMPFVVSMYHQIKPQHRARLLARSVDPCTSWCAPSASAHRTFWALPLQELYYNLLCFCARAEGHSRFVCRATKAWLGNTGVETLVSNLRRVRCMTNRLPCQKCVSCNLPEASARSSSERLPGPTYDSLPAEYASGVSTCRFSAVWPVSRKAWHQMPS